MTVKAPSLSLVCLYARERGSPLKSFSAKLGILSQPKKSQVSLKIPFEDSPVKADMFWHSSVLTLYHAGTCSSWHFQKTLTSVFSQVCISHFFTTSTRRLVAKMGRKKAASKKRSREPKGSASKKVLSTLLVYIGLHQKEGRILLYVFKLQYIFLTSAPPAGASS